MILPVGASSFTEAMKMGVEVYHHLKVTILIPDFLCKFLIINWHDLGGLFCFCFSVCPGCN